MTTPKIKLDWRKLESGSAPLPDECLIFANRGFFLDPEKSMQKTFHTTIIAGTLLDILRKGWPLPTHWALLPEFDEPEDE